MNVSMRMLLSVGLIGFLVCMQGTARSEEALAETSGPGDLFTMQDLSGDTKLKMRLPVVPCTPIGFGVNLAPMLSGQTEVHGLGLGFALPMVLSFRENGDDNIVLGNPAVELRFLVSFPADWTVHLGVVTGLSAGFLEMDESWGLAQLAGFFAHQDLLYHSPQNLVIRPLALLAVSHGGLWLQVELGSGVHVPLVRTEGRDVEAEILFQFAVGYKLEGLGRLGAEFRGLFPVSYDGVDNLMWLNLGAWLDFGALEPLVRLTIPLRDVAEFRAPMHFETGLAYRF